MPRRAGAGRLVVAVLLALVVGLGAGLLLHGPLVGGTNGDDPDLEAMCDQVDRLPETITGEDIRPDDPLLWQLQAVSGLAVAAHLNGADESFEEYGSDLLAGLQRVDQGAIDEAVAGLRAECEAR